MITDYLGLRKLIAYTRVYTGLGMTPVWTRMIISIIRKCEKTSTCLVPAG